MSKSSINFTTTGFRSASHLEGEYSKRLSKPNRSLYYRTNYRISPTRVPRVFPLFVLVPGVLVWGGYIVRMGVHISICFFKLLLLWLMNHKYIDIIIKRALLLDTTTI